MSRPPLCRFLIGLWTTLMVVGLAACARGADDAEFPRVTQLRVGINGQYQAGRWTSVVVSLEGQDNPFAGQAFLTAVDGDGAPYRIPADTAVSVNANERRDLTFHFRPAALDNAIGLILQHEDGSSREDAFTADDQREGLRAPRAMPANERLMVGVGPRVGLSAAFAQSQELAGDTRAVELDEVAQLPTSWLGLDGVDTLFVSAEDASFNDTWKAHPAQVEALTTWVRQGGRLVLAMGAQAEAVLAPDHPLSRFMSGTYEGQVALLDSQTIAWEEYASSRQPLPRLRTTIGEERLRVPKVTGLQGKVEAPLNRGVAQPTLVARLPFGLGEVVYVAADLGQPPFARWSGRNNLLRRLSRSPLVGETMALNASGNRSAVQYDLVEQLRRAMDEFPGVRLAPFLWVTMLVVGYIALVGPADFGLLRRWKGRMEWTWITFPLVVIATSAGGYWLANRLKGDQLKLNQLDVIDIDADGDARGLTITNFFSPEARAYPLSSAPDWGDSLPANEVHAWLSAFALSPAALSGDTAATSVQPLSSEPYATSPALDEIIGLPVQVWSSRAVVAEWHAKSPSLVRADLALGVDSLPEGQLRWEAPWTLEDCWLVYGDTVSQLGELRPGELAPVGARTESGWSTLSNHLRYQRRVQRTAGKDEYMMVGTQWDPESRDVKEIVRQILFYDAAGRSDYTRAWNGPLRKLDLSARRDLGQALLVGFVAEPTAAKAPGVPLKSASQTMRASPMQRWTVLRMLLPVAPQPVSDPAPNTTPAPTP